MWECQKCRERLEDSFDACWNCGAPRCAESSPETEPAAVCGQGTDSSAAKKSSRSLDQLVFVGINGYAMALDRDTGEIVWDNAEMRSGYVSLLLDGDRLIVSTNGYMYCLDPLTGNILWHNPLSGYGFGAPTSITSVRGQASTSLIQQAAAAETNHSSD